MLGLTPIVLAPGERRARTLASVPVRLCVCARYCIFQARVSNRIKSIFMYLFPNDFGDPYGVRSSLYIA